MSAPLQQAPKRKPGLIELGARAAKIWPQNPAMQKEWLRAVSVVRATSRGWVLERGEQ
jgi:hypothetical protein